MQREALPQLSTSPPSLFQIRMVTSARLDGSMHDELVAADAGPAVGDGARAGFGHGNRCRPGVEHDKVIPKTVHLAEVEGCYSAHHRAYMGNSLPKARPGPADRSLRRAADLQPRPAFVNLPEVQPFRP